MEQTSEMESSEVGDQTWKTLICSYITFENLNFVSLNDKNWGYTSALKLPVLLCRNGFVYV